MYFPKYLIGFILTASFAVIIKYLGEYNNVYLRLAGYDDETFIAVMFGYFDLISDLVDESHKMDFYSFISRHVHIQRLVCDRLI